MYETHWFALATFAALMTFAWLFVERRITTTTGIAAGLWSIAAMTAGDLERQTSCCVHPAPAPELGYVALGLALLSFLALLLYRFDHYPPEPDDRLTGSARRASGD